MTITKNDSVMHAYQAMTIGESKKSGGRDWLVYIQLLAKVVAAALDATTVILKSRNATSFLAYRI